MKLKYYLRGLGLGIAVTAIIMSIMASKGSKMTDEEIIARAKQLGLIESTVLTEGVGGEENAGQPEDGEGQPEDGEGQPKDGEGNTEGQTDAGQPGLVTVKPEEAENMDGDAANPDTQADADGNGNAAASDTQGNADGGGNAAVSNGQTNAGSNYNAAEPNTQADGVAVTASSFPKVLIIKSGEGSYTVSKKLKEIGAVESAEDFDTYLCENGYDKKIRAGTYTIPVDATNEQMAKIVTGAKITE